MNMNIYIYIYVHIYTLILYTTCTILTIFHSFYFDVYMYMIDTTKPNTYFLRTWDGNLHMIIRDARV